MGRWIVCRLFGCLLLLLAAGIGIAPLPAQANHAKSIRVVIDDNYPPYIFRDEQGRLQGILKDLWDLWAQRTGVEVNLAAMDWNSALREMADGDADAIDTVFKTASREQQMDFSAPYSTIDVAIFFRKDLNGINKANSLQGFTVGVKAGDACMDWLSRRGINSFHQYSSYESLIDGAAAGEVLVFCIDMPPALHFMLKKDLLNRFRYTEPLYSGQFHWATRKGDIATRTLIADGFARITADERQAIENRWFGHVLDKRVDFTRLAQWVGAALAGIALLLVWNQTLRRKVAARTRELAAAKAQYDDLAVGIPVGAYRFRTDPDGTQTFEYVSPRMDEMLGLAPGELLRDSSLAFSIAVPEDRDELVEQNAQAAATQTPFRWEGRLLVRGEIRWMLIESRPHPMPNGSLIWNGVLSDISARKEAEIKAARLSKLYAALSQCNQAIVRCDKEDELFALICRVAVEYGGMATAWISHLNEETGIASPVASFGLDPALMPLLQVPIDESDPRGRGPSGEALRTNIAYWCQDIEQDPRLVPWRKLFQERGWAAAAALPLLRRGRTFGCLVLYSRTSNAFDEQAQELLNEMASDVSFALDNLLREAERHQAQARIAELAFYDQLTGLPNRTLLFDRIGQAIVGSARNTNRSALLFIDLDNFKTLNDSLGHDMGDELLRQVAQRLTALIRADDTVARFGGDEFILVLSGLTGDETDAANAVEAVGVKILHTLDAAYLLGEHSYRCTASIGATLLSSEVVSVEDLLKQADLAMYTAKTAGRNTLRFFDPKLQQAVLERVSLESDIGEALKLGQFELHYQPQVQNARGIVGAEALLRWKHPKRGMVAPSEFIPLAEETGQILAIGSWVLETACKQLAAWAQQADLARLSIAVNVSARQFGEPDFVKAVEESLHKTGADPHLLKIELTESLLVSNIPDVISKMNMLKSSGICFSLDDFGTGYSSFAYLKRFPLEQLKIDQSFVHDLMTDPNDAAIAKTIVALAQSLGLGVIAEGVETEEQRNLLSELGCYSFQGYLFSRPLPLAEFENLVLDGVVVN